MGATVQNELEGKGHESKAGFIGTIYFFFPPQRIKKLSTECGQDPHTHRHLSGRSKTQDKENCKNEYIKYSLFTPTQQISCSISVPNPPVNSLPSTSPPALLFLGAQVFPLSLKKIFSLFSILYLSLPTNISK